MAKKIYIGINNIARKVKKMYVGVNGVARKVKKAYIGIGGVARPCFSPFPEPTHYGRTSQGLTYARPRLAATTVGNYALFGGGYTVVDGFSGDEVDGFDTSLTRVSVSRLQHDNQNARNAATAVGNYALFAGGEATLLDRANNDHVTAYDTSLTRSYPSNLDDYAARLAATTVGGYALFGGGRSRVDAIENWTVVQKEDWKYNVVAYNTSLSKSTVANLSSERCELAATTVGSYALFGAGDRNGSRTNTVDTYNASLTKGTTTSLTIAVNNLAATSVGGYALFAGGDNGYGYKVSDVDAYDSSLTKITTVAPLAIARDKLAATTLGDFALFGGGSGTNYVEVYDKNLTKQSTVLLSSARSYLAATTLGGYALFGGGDHGGDSDIVDVYVVV